MGQQQLIKGVMAMKTFYRTYLPDFINYNGKKYIYFGSKNLNKKPDKAIIVKVLSRNLRGKTDLHGLPYKPTEWYFIPESTN